MMSAPLLLVAASCVPAAAVDISRPAAAASASARAPAKVPEWAKLEPGMPYRLLEPTAATAQPFAERARSEDDQLRSIDCLANAIYYEARSESDDGQRAVAQVVLNRVRHPAFPNTVCGVVYQGSYLRTGCQFSFTCDGSLALRPAGIAWARARRIAADALSGEVYGPVGNATHYHTTAILPYWAGSLARAAVVGAHIFYRMRGSLGAPDAFSQHYAGWEPTPSRAAQEYEAVPAALASVAEIEGGVRKWRGTAVGGVRIHRGSESKPAPSVAPAVAEAEEQGSFGVQIHRGGDTEADVAS